jgi:hypothetical protein
VNAVERVGGDAGDSGGQLNMCMGISGATWAFSQLLPADAMVRLATDGLTDNLPADWGRDGAAADGGGGEGGGDNGALLVSMVCCPALDQPIPGPGLGGQQIPPSASLRAELEAALGAPLSREPWETVRYPAAAAARARVSPVAVHCGFPCDDGVRVHFAAPSLATLSSLSSPCVR